MLFTSALNKPSRLLGVSVKELEKYASICGLFARELSNKLSPLYQRSPARLGVNAACEARPTTVDFLRSYPALQQKSNEQLSDIATKLENELIETTLDLDQVSRGLLSLKIPVSKEDSKAFQVGALVRGAKLSKGARGNVFKFVQRHLGHHLEKEGIQIYYKRDDLHIQVYFVSCDAACQLQNGLIHWEIHKELENLKGVTLNPLTPAQVPKPPDLKRIYLQDYDPLDSELPCQTLDQLHLFSLSVPETEPVEAITPLVHCQSIDKRVPHVHHYKCRLKDKMKFKMLQTYENSMFAACWVFHQQLDGIKVDEQKKTDLQHTKTGIMLV